jgi:copper transport protein
VTTAVRRLWFAVIAVAIVVGPMIAPTPAAFTPFVAAHAGLDVSVPAPSSVLEQGPPSILLDFDEPVEVTLASIELFDSSARRIPLGAVSEVAGDGSVIQASVPDLDDGIHAVVWRVTSLDGHVVDGSFSFTVGRADGDADALLEQVGGGAGVDPVVERLAVFARLVAFVGLVVFLGAGLFALQVSSFPTATAGLLRAGWVMLAVGTTATFGFHAAAATAGTWTDAFAPDAWSAIAATDTGRALLVRLVLVAVLGTMALVADHRRRATAWWRSLVGLAAIGLVLTHPAAGHAAATSPRALFTVVDAVHLAGIVVWLGGLVLFTLGGRAWLRDDATAPVVRRFSRLAGVVVPIVVVTGVAQTRELADGFAGITDTAWGRALLVKLTIVVVLVTVGGVSRWLLRHHGPSSLGRTVALEAVLGVAVLATVAFMVAESPRPIDDGRAFSATLAQDGLIVDISVTPGRVGANEVHVVITPPGGNLRPVTDATVRMALPERDVPLTPATMRSEGVNHYSGVITLAFPGDWRLDVVVEEAPGRQVLLSTTVPIP